MHLVPAPYKNSVLYNRFMDIEEDSLLLPHSFHTSLHTKSRLRYYKRFFDGFLSFSDVGAGKIPVVRVHKLFDRQAFTLEFY